MISFADLSPPRSRILRGDDIDLEPIPSRALAVAHLEDERATISDVQARMVQTAAWQRYTLYSRGTPSFVEFLYACA